VSGLENIFVQRVVVRSELEIQTAVVEVAWHVGDLLAAAAAAAYTRW
jgi:hypothetical protein